MNSLASGPFRLLPAAKEKIKKTLKHECQSAHVANSDVFMCATAAVWSLNITLWSQLSPFILAQVPREELRSPSVYTYSLPAEPSNNFEIFELLLIIVTL